MSNLETAAKLRHLVSQVRADAARAYVLLSLDECEAIAKQLEDAHQFREDAFSAHPNLDLDIEATREPR